MPYVRLQFLLRIRYAPRKAFLVHTPQKLEVFRSRVTNYEGHRDIVAATSAACPILTLVETSNIAGSAAFPQPLDRNMTKNFHLRTIVLLLDPQPRTYHRHQR